LPQLLTTAQTAVAAYPGTDDQGRRARTLLSQAYQVTASTLWKLKEADLAWLAAERGFVLAEETGDSLLISDAARRVTHGLMVIGHYDQALELVRADIDRLEPGRGTGSAAYLSLYGMLFLMGAVVAARATNRTAASDLLEPVGKWSCGLLILSFGRRGYGAGLAPSGMRRCAGRGAGQLPGHDRDGGPEHHGLVVFGASFVVADQAAVAH
jgi:hypothetical protein